MKARSDSLRPALFRLSVALAGFCERLHDQSTDNFLLYCAMSARERLARLLGHTLLHRVSGEMVELVW